VAAIDVAHAKGLPIQLTTPALAAATISKMPVKPLPRFLADGRYPGGNTSPGKMEKANSEVRARTVVGQITRDREYNDR
jgi:hypothetical protein